MVMNDWACENCGFVGKPDLVPRENRFHGILMGIIFVPLAILTFRSFLKDFWKPFLSDKKCPQCGKKYSYPGLP